MARESVVQVVDAVKVDGVWVADAAIAEADQAEATVEEQVIAYVNETKTWREMDAEERGRWVSHVYTAMTQWNLPQHRIARILGIKRDTLAQRLSRWQRLPEGAASQGAPNTQVIKAARQAERDPEAVVAAMTPAGRDRVRAATIANDLEADLEPTRAMDHWDKTPKIVARTFAEEFPEADAKIKGAIEHNEKVVRWLMVYDSFTALLEDIVKTGDGLDVEALTKIHDLLKQVNVCGRARNVKRGAAA
jgi:hypothetical protein